MKLGKLFHIHRYEVFGGSGLGNGLNFKVCRAPGCSHCETQMYDFSKNEYVWVEGNFVENIETPVFIIAEEFIEYKKVIQYIPAHAANATRLARTTTDLEEMKKYRSPRFLLAQDYHLTDIAQMDEFRKLMVTRHL